MVSFSKVKEEGQFLWWELIIILEERKQELDSRLPEVSDLEFEEYCLIVELLGVLYERVPQI